MSKQPFGVKGVAIGNPSDPPRCDSRDPPFDFVSVAKLGAFREKQADEFLAHIAESDHRQIECANGPLLRRRLMNCEGFAAGEASGRAQLFFDAEQLIVLGDAVGA